MIIEANILRIYEDEDLVLCEFMNNDDLFNRFLEKKYFPKNLLLIGQAINVSWDTYDSYEYIVTERTINHENESVEIKKLRNEIDELINLF